MQTNALGLTEKDRVALLNAIQRNSFANHEGASAFVKSMILTMTPEQLLQLVNYNTELSKFVFKGIGQPSQLLVAGLLVRWDKLENLPLPNYAIDRYPVYEKGFNLLYGKPGAGKSLVAIDAAAQIAKTHPDRTVIYAAAEGKEGLSVRLKAWAQHNKHNPDNLYVFRQEIRFLNDDSIQEFKTQCETMNVKPDFIIVDTLARSMVGVNENDTTAMGLFVDAVDRLRSDLNCGVMFVHHTNKLGGIRGSSVLEGALDSILKIEALDTQIVAYNSLSEGGKNKDREEYPPIYLNKLPVQVDVNGTMQNAVVIELGKKVVQIPTADAISPRQRQILEVLDTYESGLTAKQLSDATKIQLSTVYDALKRLKSSNFVTHDNQRDRFVITPLGHDAL